MSLLQLLTTGKALEGLENSSHRYHMTNQRLLPKFGSRRNPFSASEAPPAEPVEAKALTAPVAAKPPPSVFSAGPARKPEGGWFAKWLGEARSKVLGWVRKPVQKVPRQVAAATQPVPRQGELRLEGIKVMRNDLSETDLEIVKAIPAPEAGSAAEARPAGKPVERQRAWERMRSRLVGAGKN
jgi:hypothetical protein